LNKIRISSLNDEQDENDVKKSQRQTNITEQLHPQDDKTDIRNKVQSRTLLRRA
jgi:hypothetical protein